MNKRQFEALWKKLAPFLPGYSYSQKMFFAVPLGHVLRGFHFGVSGFDPNGFWLHVFYMPMFVPRKHLVLSFGNRLVDDRRCEKWWDINEPNLVDEVLSRVRSQGLPFLDGLETLDGLAKITVERYGKLMNSPCQEVVAYSFVMVGDFVSAVKHLDLLITIINPNNSAHDRANLERQLKFKDLLHADAHAAKQQLLEWEKETIANLGLQAYVGDSGKPDGGPR
jgi:hypothetical protein